MWTVLLVAFAAAPSLDILVSFPQTAVFASSTESTTRFRLSNTPRGSVSTFWLLAAFCIVQKHDALSSYSLSVRTSNECSHLHVISRPTASHGSCHNAGDEYLPLRRCKMGIWEGMELLDTLTDSSDPDTDLSQLEHCLQVNSQEPRIVC